MSVSDLAARHCVTLDLDVETASYIASALHLASQKRPVFDRRKVELMRYFAAVEKVQRILRASLAETIASGGEHAE